MNRDRDLIMEGELDCIIVERLFSPYPINKLFLTGFLMIMDRTLGEHVYRPDAEV